MSINISDLTEAEQTELALIKATGKTRNERLLEYAAHDTIYDLSYILKKLEAREIDGDEKARALIEVMINHIIRHRPLTWGDYSIYSTGLSTEATGKDAYGNPLCNGHKPQP